MTRILDGMSASLFPGAARRSLLRFIDEETDIRRRVALRVARLDLIRMRRELGGSVDVGEDEVEAHLEACYGHLRERIGEEMDLMVRRSIPGFNWLAILGNVSVLAAIVLPAVSVLAGDVAERPDGMRVFAFFALVALVAGTVYAMARESMRKNP